MGHEAAVLQSIDGDAMALTGVSAQGKVEGLLFELAVEQRYRNATATNIEAVYTFPLPSAAVLLGLTVRLGERELVGVVVEKRAAEERYEDALDKGNSAVLLEQAGDGLCTLNLGNLMAGEEAVIRYRYAQLLRFEQGSVRLTVPTVIAPRYGDPAAGGLQPHQAPVTDLRVEYPFALEITLTGAVANGAIASPSHRIVFARTAEGLRVGIAGGAFLDRDFVLTVSGLPASSLAVAAMDGERYVAVASFCAEAPMGTDAPNAANAPNAMPLRLKLLVDCSGSMGGDSIDTAKRALHRILECLRPADRFTFSRFGSTVRHEIGRFTAADPSGIRAASTLVARADADLGGTEMETALRSVFELDGKDGTADVFLITDGEIWAADSLIAAARSAGQRVFVTGIGSSPNESAIRRLAEATGGASEFIAPNEDAEAGILRMFGRLRAPRIERAEVTWPIAPLWTTPLPRGLFGGETVHVFAGFATPPAGDAVVHLHPGAGAKPQTAAVVLPERFADDATLARMAASSRIASVDDESRLALALQYSLLTERTSFVVVHQRADGERAVDLPALAAVAQMHAAGWGGVGSVHAPRFSLGSAVAREHLARPAFGSDLVRRADMECIVQPARAMSRRYADGRAGKPLGRPAPVSPAAIDASIAIDLFLRALASGLPPSGRPTLPATRRELEAAGAPESLLAAVDELVRQGSTESEAVRAMLGALADFATQHGHSRQLVRELRRMLRGDGASVELRCQAADAMVRLLSGAPPRPARRSFMSHMPE